MFNYDISWDYELDEDISKKEHKQIKSISNNIKQYQGKLLPEIKDFEVEAIILPDGLLGIYCKGSKEYATIGIDIGNIKIACEKYNVDVVLAIKTTILHELKHAEQDILDLPLNEDEAENEQYNN